MSKISYQMILGLLALVMKFLRSAIRVVRTIRDLADDGQLNGSADLPTWLDQIETILRQAFDVVNEFDAETTEKGYIEPESPEGHA